jgi:phage tail protein X
MPETVTVQGENLTLDLILWRKHGKIGQDLVEQALELNPGLAALGPVLPLGTKVTLPDRPASAQRKARPVVSLFKRSA